MAYFEHEGERVLFARGPYGACCVVSILGSDHLKAEFENYSTHMGDHLSDKQIPENPGLYVWEGKTHGDTGGWCGSEPVEADFYLEGAVRPATAEDLATFGIPLAEAAPC